MAITFNSKEDADKATNLKLQKQLKTEVLYKNARTGREVVTIEYYARKMVRRGEGEILEVLGDTAELKKKRATKVKQVEALAKAREAKAKKGANS